MTISRRSIAGAIGALALANPLVVHADEAYPRGYPRSYSGLAEQAGREGALSIYSSADLTDMAGVLNAFKQRYPAIKVDYRHFNSTDLYDRFLAEVGVHKPSADFLFSSAMDVQIKLVNDGYAQPYASPEKPNLPPWAVWKDEAYGITAEPIVFAYNRRLLSVSEAPRSHVDLERLLRRRAAALRGKIGTYDVEHSSTGFLFFTQDLRLSNDTWNVLRALGGASPKLDVGAHEILARVSTGEQILAYNVMSSYALERRAMNPWVEVIFPEDYTLVMSRIGFISNNAHHPAAAKLFLDFLLSREGQTELSKRFITPVRTDLQAAQPHGGAQNLQAIRVGPELMANLDHLKHAKRIAEWKRALGR